MRYDTAEKEESVRGEIRNYCTILYRTVPYCTARERTCEEEVGLAGYPAR